MDGNNSMKWVDGLGHVNQHVFVSDYLITPSKVDRFKDNVKTHPGAQNWSLSFPALPHGQEKTSCTDNWTAANSVSKGIVNMFQQTGSFFSACWHSIIETLAEMLYIRKKGFGPGETQVALGNFYSPKEYLALWATQVSLGVFGCLWKPSELLGCSECLWMSLDCLSKMHRDTPETFQRHPETPRDTWAAQSAKGSVPHIVTFFLDTRGL